MRCTRLAQGTSLRFDSWNVGRTLVFGAAGFRKLMTGKCLDFFGAEGGIRTPTGRPTRPSSVRVCQFHHFGTWRGLRGRPRARRL